MRLLSSTSPGDVEPMVGVAVQRGAGGAEVRVGSPPECAELPPDVGVPVVPIGQPLRPPVTVATAAAGLPPRVADQ